ncbi:hypothetical protein PV326_009098 [Microctonus aethiopoides]|uniref:BEN domain-containing protein n=1 Tax=Microctonus aethiopoides TaxID=144406 RepID=A0AA39F8V1_9HYME|nr:hypothetical protein PV326_009098 [Microctonus aethiopoides]KAK0165095.1 hypothetical protein PV328_003646 [Microctonus aethiopoides]
MPPRIKQFALIWWIECGKKDVIPLTNIPKKNRKVNNIINIKWVDNATKSSRKYDAKILAIGDNETELHQVLVTNEGIINDPVNKIFTSEVLNNNKEFAESKKLRKSMVRSSKIQVIEKFKHDLPIFFGPPQNVIQSSIPYPTPTMPVSTTTLSSTVPKIISTLSSETINSHKATPLSSCTNSMRCHVNDEISNTSPINLKSQTAWNNFPSASYNQPSVAPAFVDVTNNNYSCSRNEAKISPCFATTQTQLSGSPVKLIPGTTVSESIKLINPLSYLPHENEMDVLPYRDSVQQFTGMEIQESTAAEKSSMSVHINDTCNHLESERIGSPHKDNESSSTSTIDMDNIDDDIENEIADAGLYTTLSGIRLGKVTKQDIARQKCLLEAMTKEYNEQEKRNLNSKESLKVSDYYFSEGPEKVEVSPCSGFFLPKNKWSYIGIKAGIDHGWHTLVRETLLEVYGNSISQFSATGKRGFRPRIDSRIFKGLFGWALSYSNDKVTKKQLITVINKFASNKRKYSKKKKNFNKQSKVIGTRKDLDRASKCHSNIEIGIDPPNKRVIESTNTFLQSHSDCNVYGNYK